ncbi:MAG: sigma-70 family RNA polymerase sigma factor, partial [Eubacterium sp.]
MNEIKGKSLQLLVIRAQKGDDTAFSELFHSTCKQQYHYARTLMKDSFLAEDIVQEVYIKLYKNIGQLREPGAFLGYLYRMTYNESMRYLHKKYLDLETTVEQDFLNTFETTQSVPETALLSDEKSTLLAEGLKTLSEEERFALMMHYCENMTINEIEEALNLSRSTVRRRINSAKEKMACYLSDREMRGLLFAPALLTKTEETALLDTILAQKEPFKEQKKHSLKS